mgnify:CR=1 FL=1
MPELLPAVYSGANDSIVLIGPGKANLQAFQRHGFAGMDPNLAQERLHGESLHLGQSAADDFAEGGEIGHNVKTSLRPGIGKPEASDHFIKHQQRAVQRRSRSP